MIPKMNKILHLRMKIKIFLIALALLPMLAINAQQSKNIIKTDKQPFIAMFYNVENFYDTQNDPKTNDDEFTPAGKVPWTEERLETKIKHIGQVISDVASPAMPDLVGFAEVENLALTQVFPSGWEIINERLFGGQVGSQFNYRDIRDDRVLTYFSLKMNEQKEFKVKLNATLSLIHI